MQRSVIVVLILLALVTSAGCSARIQGVPEVTTPVEEKPNLVVDQNWHFKYVTNEMILVVGTVTNKSTFPVSNIKITFDIIGQQGTTLGRADAYLGPDEFIGVGEFWSYEAVYYGEGACVAREAVVVSLTID